MKMFLFGTALAALCFFLATSAMAQEKLADTLSANRFVLNEKDGKLSGPGADLLLREAADSQFILVGEPHGIVDVPEFLEKLFELAHRSGFSHLAVETGPLTAARMESFAGTPNGFADFILKYPFGLPFYNWREESVLLQNVEKMTQHRRNTVWGLDQEFMASSAFHFERLFELAPNANVKSMVKPYLERARTEFDRVVKSRNPGLMFLASAKGEDFDKLDAAFRGSRNKEATTLLKELRISAEIYSKIFSGRGYESNRQRSLLMKAHFMDYYRAVSRTEKLPKVMFKFGSNHVKRGLNYTSIYDLGNFVSELADANGTKSLHILMIANGGTQNAFVPFAGSEADKAKTIDTARSNNFADIRPLLELSNGDEKFLVDLRPLRSVISSGRLKDLPNGFADLVLGYDVVVVMPNVRAATNLPWTATMN